MSVQPAIAANGLKVRRYVSSDISKILELAHQACEQASVPYDEKRLKFVLDNNVNNLFLCCLVLIDLAEVVGVLIANMKKSALNNDSFAEDDLFYLPSPYEDYVNLMWADYLDWSRQRGCKEAKLSNVFMPDMSMPLTEYSVWKETL